MVNIDKKLVQNSELTFLKENKTRTLLLNDDGVVELYEEGKLLDSKPFSKINVEREYKKIIQEGYTLMGDEEVKYNVYLLCGEDGVYTSSLVDTVESEEQAQDRVAELEAENGCGAYYKKVVNGKELEESKNSEKHFLLSKLFKRYSDITDEDEDYFNSLSYEDLVKEIKNRDWIDLLEEEATPSEANNYIIALSIYSFRVIANDIKNEWNYYGAFIKKIFNFKNSNNEDDIGFSITRNPKEAQRFNKFDGSYYAELIEPLIKEKTKYVTVLSILDESKEEIKTEANNQQLQNDLDQTEQELEDDIEQVDRAQELKDELEDKLNKLYNESKELKMENINNLLLQKDLERMSKMKDINSIKNYLYEITMSQSYDEARNYLIQILKQAIIDKNSNVIEATNQIIKTSFGGLNGLEDFFTLNESKDEIKDVFGIEPGSDEEALLDNIYDTDYDLVWDELDDDEKQEYINVAKQIRRLKPEEAFIHIEQEIDSKAKENKLQKDILTYVYLNITNKKLQETTAKQLQRLEDELREKQRQALKDAGDPNWQNLVGIAKRLPAEVWKPLELEEDKLSCISMIHSILTYADPVSWNEKYVLSNKYMQKYFDMLGEDKVKELVNQEIEEYKNNAVVDTDVYTDSEGVSYNSVSFKNENKSKKEEISVRTPGTVVKNIKEISPEIPTGENINKKLSKQQIEDLKTLDLNKDQKQFLDSMDITEEEIIDAFKDLVGQMKHLQKDKPFMSIEEYVNEVLKF